MFYYADELNKAVPIADVMNSYGLDVAFGRNVKCPSPSHKDKYPSAKIYKKGNNCYCFSCNQNFTPIKIVMEYENLSDNELPKACQILCEKFGLDRRDFGEGIELDTDYTKEDDPFPFSYDELRLIGLEKSYAPQTFTSATGEKIPLPTIKDLYDKNSDWCDRQFLFEMVQRKAQDLKEDFTRWIALLDDNIAEAEAKPDFEKNYHLMEVYNKAKDNGEDWRKLIPKGMSAEEHCNRICEAIYDKDYVNDRKLAYEQFGKCKEILQKCEDFFRENPIQEAEMTKPVQDEIKPAVPEPKELKPRLVLNKDKVQEKPMSSFGKSDINLSKNIKKESRIVGKIE